MYAAAFLIASHAVLAGDSARKASSRTVCNEFLDGT
jgi:hypothetical protein